MTRDDLRRLGADLSAKAKEHPRLIGQKALDYIRWVEILLADNDELDKLVAISEENP